MRESLHLWPHVGRALRQASMTPVLAGTLTFSMGLMVVGVTVYAGAVPVLMAESPLVSQFLSADESPGHLGSPAETSGTVNGTGGRPSSNDARPNPSAAPGALPLTAGGDGDNLSSQGAPSTEGPVVLSPSDFGYTPLAPAPREDDGADGGASPDGPVGSGHGSDGGSGTGNGSNGNGSNGSGDGGSGNSGNGSGGGSGNDGSGGNSGNPGNSDNPDGSGGSGSVPEPEPEPPAPAPVLPPEEGGPVPEEMELRIRDALRSECDVLERWAAKVYDGAAEYNRLCLTGTKKQRKEAAESASQLFYDVQVAHSTMSLEVGYACGNSSGFMWGTSRYVGNYAQMNKSYTNLVYAAYELDYAWAGNCKFDDPAAHTDAWAGRVTVNQATGQMAYMEAYEAARTGVRP